MCLKKNMKFISLADVNFIFFSLFFQLNRVGIKRLKHWKRPLWCPTVKSVLVLNVLLGGKKNLIGIIQKNWYNNIHPLGSKNSQRKLHVFFFSKSPPQMTPAIFVHPDPFTAQEEEILHGTIWGFFFLWNTFFSSLLGGKFENMSSPISASNVAHEPKELGSFSAFNW